MSDPSNILLLFFTTPWVSLMTTKWIVNCCCLLYFLCLFPHLDYILLFHPCTVQYIRLASFKAMHITANAQTHSLPHEPSRQGTMSHCTVSTNCQKQSKECLSTAPWRPSKCVSWQDMTLRWSNPQLSGTQVLTNMILFFEILCTVISTIAHPWLISWLLDSCTIAFKL